MCSLTPQASARLEIFQFHVNYACSLCTSFTYIHPELTRKEIITRGRRCSLGFRIHHTRSGSFTFSYHRGLWAGPLSKAVNKKYFIWPTMAVCLRGEHRTRSHLILPSFWNLIKKKSVALKVGSRLVMISMEWVYTLYTFRTVTARLFALVHVFFKKSLTSEEAMILQSFQKQCRILNEFIKNVRRTIFGNKIYQFIHHSSNKILKSIFFLLKSPFKCPFRF